MGKTRYLLWTHDITWYPFYQWHYIFIIYYIELIRWLKTAQNQKKWLRSKKLDFGQKMPIPDFLIIGLICFRNTSYPFYTWHNIRYQTDPMTQTRKSGLEVVRLWTYFENVSGDLTAQFFFAYFMLRVSMRGGQSGDPPQAKTLPS